MKKNKDEGKRERTRKKENQRDVDQEKWWLR